MNFCTNCGSKLDKSNKFCTKCGTKIISNKEKNNQNVILMLGIFLVLFSTFALGIISWNDMNHILRLCFFGFECVLFFGLSFVLKKLTDNKLYRLFFVVGLLLIPYTLSLIPYYGLLTDYFNNGPGLYIYLAIIYFLTAFIYLIINNKFKSGFVNLISLISLLVSFISIALIFSDSIVIISLLITSYMFIINILSKLNVFSDNLKKTMNIFVYILLIVDFLILISSFNKEPIILNNILNVISLLLYIITGYLFINKNKNTAYRGILPFLFTILSVVYLNNVFIIYHTISIYSIAIVSLILYFISHVYNDKLLKDMTLGITYSVLLILMLISIFSSYNLILLVISIMTLLFTLFNIFVSGYKWLNYFIPFNIFIIIVSINNITINFKLIYELIVTALLYLIIYVLLKVNKNKYSLTYLIGAYALVMIGMYNFAFGYNIINFGIILILLFIFVFSYLFKENIAISIISFVSLNISSFMVYINTDHPVYYGLLTISSLTLIFSLLLTKLRNIDLKPYILYSEIVIFIITLTNNMQYASYILYINIFIYALSYLSVIKFHNYKWWRLVYIMLGLLTIIRVVNTLINPIVIASLISIIIILIVLTIMYLLDVENNISIALLSLVTLYPYYNLVINNFSDISELYIIPFVIYTIVFTEITPFKNKENQKLSTIIPLSILSYFFVVIGNGVPSIIIDVILSLTFILLGLHRKYNYFIYFGVIFMIVTIFIRLFTILNSLLVVIILIIIGFILIGAVLYNDVKF